MKQRIPSILVAIYVLGCIIFGGSTQSPWPNLGLQIFGIGLISCAAINPTVKDLGWRPQLLNVLLLCALAVVLIQLIPLPVGLWTRLPGRGHLVEGFAILGYPLRRSPISEAPYESIMTLFAAIPAIAVFVATERLSPCPSYLAAAIVAGMVGGIFLGAVQVSGGPESWAYFYEIHNAGAVGLFANANHMATLLLAGIPMAAALLASSKSKRRNSDTAQHVLGLGVLGLVIVGIVLNGSRAAIGLCVPVVIASLALFHAAARWRTAALFLCGATLLAGITLILSNPLNLADINMGTVSSSTTRGEIWKTTAEAIHDTFPFGTGLGTFENAYHYYEDPDLVTLTYVNHAHNDYLELILELGSGGLLIIAAFLIWWAMTARQIWTAVYSSPFSRAATIATAAILVHSTVDFPLRTGAISVIFAVCTALMNQPNGSDHRSTASFGTSRPARHVKLG